MRAFVLEGDPHPTTETSDKAGVKRRERVQRDLARSGLPRQPNSTTVAAERALTKAVLSRRGEL
jgi:hypothetical protein